MQFMTTKTKRANSFGAPLALASLVAVATAQSPQSPEGPPTTTVVDSLEDVAGGPPLRASSIPLLGFLYPLSTDLFVDATGAVGIGTASPISRLTVEGGDALVDGEFWIGLAGAQDVLVREAFDGRPTVELRDGTLQTLVTLGESSLSPGVRTGLELVDPVTSLPLFRSGSADTIEMTDAQTGALALRLGPDQLSAFSEAEVLTLRLSGDPTNPALAQLYDENGVEKARVDVDVDSIGGARMRLFSPAGTDELQVGRRLASPDGSVGENRIAVGTGVEWSTRRPGGAADSGSLVMRWGTLATMFFEATAPSGGPEMTLTDGLGGQLRMLGQGSFGSPTLELVESGVEVLQVDAGSAAESSRMTFSDALTGAPLTTVAGDASGGSVFSVWSTDGFELVRLDPELGEIRLRDANGVLRLQFQGTQLELFDNGGNSTISYDGQTAMKNGVVATEDHGERYLYAVESPEVWFEDAGCAQLQAGSARVDLDPMFLETVTISEDERLVVFATPTARCAGLWVEVDERGFTVHERGGGTSDASFDWRVLARRRGFEDVRMEPVRLATTREPSEGKDS